MDIIDNRIQYSAHSFCAAVNVAETVGRISLDLTKGRIEMMVSRIQRGQIKFQAGQITTFLRDVADMTCQAAQLLRVLQKALVFRRVSVVLGFFHDRAGLAINPRC